MFVLDALHIRLLQDVRVLKGLTWGEVLVHYGLNEEEQ